MNISPEIWLDKLQILGATVVQPQGMEKGAISYEDSPLIEVTSGVKSFSVPNTLDLKYILIRFGSSSANLINYKNGNLYKKFYGPYGVFTNIINFDDLFIYFTDSKDNEFEHTWDPADHTNRSKRVDLTKPEKMLTHHVVPWSTITHLMTKSKFIFY